MSISPSQVHFRNKHNLITHSASSIRMEIKLHHCWWPAGGQARLQTDCHVGTNRSSWKTFHSHTKHLLPWGNNDATCNAVQIDLRARSLRILRDWEAVKHGARRERSIPPTPGSTWGHVPLYDPVSYKPGTGEGLMPGFSVHRFEWLCDYKTALRVSIPSPAFNLATALCRISGRFWTESNLVHTPQAALRRCESAALPLASFLCFVRKGTTSDGKRECVTCLTTSFSVMSACTCSTAAWLLLSSLL